MILVYKYELCKMRFLFPRPNGEFAELYPAFVTSALYLSAVVVLKGNHPIIDLTFNQSPSFNCLGLFLLFPLGIHNGGGRSKVLAHHLSLSHLQKCEQWLFEV